MKDQERTKSEKQTVEPKLFIKAEEFTISSHKSYTCTIKLPICDFALQIIKENKYRKKHGRNTFTVVHTHMTL